MGYGRTSLGSALLSSRVGVQAVNSLSDRWVGPGACASLPSRSVHPLARGACCPSHLPVLPLSLLPGEPRLWAYIFHGTAVACHSWHAGPWLPHPICGSGSSLVSRPLARPFSPLGVVWRPEQPAVGPPTLMSSSEGLGQCWERPVLLMGERNEGEARLSWDRGFLPVSLCPHGLFSSSVLGMGSLSLPHNRGEGLAPRGAPSSAQGQEAL